MKSLSMHNDHMNPEHGIACELDLARTTAASLHLARTEAQLVSRIALVRECCAAARCLALTAARLDLVLQADDLLNAVNAALLPAAQLAA